MKIKNLKQLKYNLNQFLNIAFLNSYAEPGCFKIKNELNGNKFDDTNTPSYVVDELKNVGFTRAMSTYHDGKILSAEKGDYSFHLQKCDDMLTIYYCNKLLIRICYTDYSIYDWFQHKENGNDIDINETKNFLTMYNNAKYSKENGDYVAKPDDEAQILLQNFFLLKVVHNREMEFSDIFDEPFKLPFPFDIYYKGYSLTYFNYSIFHIEFKNGYVNVVKYTYEN